MLSGIQMAAFEKKECEGDSNRDIVECVRRTAKVLIRHAIHASKEHPEERNKDILRYLSWLWNYRESCSCFVLFNIGREKAQIIANLMLELIEPSSRADRQLTIGFSCMEEIEHTRKDCIHVLPMPLK